jgi:hypothetical protein
MGQRKGGEMQATVVNEVASRRFFSTLGGTLPDSNHDEKPEITLPLRVRGETREVVDSLKAEFGTSQTELGARLFDWFASQSKEFRAEVIRRGDAVGQLVRERLAAMSNAENDVDAGRTLTLEQAVRLIRQMTDRIEQIELARKRQHQSPAQKKPRGA